MFLLESCSQDQAQGIRLHSIQEVISQVMKTNASLITPEIYVAS